MMLVGRRSKMASLLSKSWVTLSNFRHHFLPSNSNSNSNNKRRCIASCSMQAGEVMEFLDSLKNYEKQGLPHGAGTDSVHGFDLGRMHRLLAHLGDPHSQYPVVHVAGTKGKGSTVAFISSILRAQGYFVGTYTSPHVETIRERVTAGGTGEPISMVALQELFEDVHTSLKEAVATEHGALTHFEVFTALAFKHFAREKVDIAVIEAGLGGARDATNVIQASNLAVAVITNVGEEHMNVLGGSIESIAFAKAGIIKDGCLVVLGGPMDPGIENIFKKVAASRKAKVIPCFGVGVNYSVRKVHLDDESAFQCCDVKVNIEVQGSVELNAEKYGLCLHAVGTHQLVNAVTAICTTLCLREKGWKIEDRAIWAGLESTVIPGRFQLVGCRKADKIGCKNAVLVLDGAHTAKSAAALAETLRTFFQKESISFVVAMALDKDHSAFAKQLLLGTMPSVVVTTEVPVVGAHTRSTPPHVLANVWKRTADESDIVVHVLGLDWEAENGGKGTVCEYSSSESGTEVKQEISELNQFLTAQSKQSPTKHEILVSSTNSMKTAIERASHLLTCTSKSGVICVTGSLHAVSVVLSLLQND